MKRIHILCLFLVVCATQRAADFNILDYGAANDTTKLSTEAVQRAIDDCSAAGGGRVVVPTGQFKIGTIVLRSNVNLHLSHGATLYGSTSLDDYRPMRTSYVSLRTQTSTVQLIFADNVDNVLIDGSGTIDGRGRAFPKLSWNDEGITRPHLIRFIQSRDITLRGVTLRNSGCWMQHYLACDRLRIENVRIFNRNNYNNDAIDIDGCHDVLVQGVFADSDDDAITLKSTSPRRCENVRISDCVVSSHCNAVKLGTETNGGFRNINISGIVVKPSEDQNEKFFGQWRGTSAISLEIVDGGVLENVNVSDFTVEGTESPIFVRLGNRARGYFEGQQIDYVGQIRDVTIDNIRIKNAGPVGCSITGLPGHPVERVRVSRVSLHHDGGIADSDMDGIRQSIADEKAKEYPEATMWGNLPARGFYVRHARNIQIDDLKVVTDNSDCRPDVVSEDVE